MHLLFICSRNQWRSPTAETIYKNAQSIEARSAGTEPSARIKVNIKMIDWADIIFVTEKKHKQRLLERFSQACASKEIIVLDIPDDYAYMEEELIESITSSVSPYLKSL